MSTVAKAALVLLVGFMVLALFTPSVRQFFTRTFSNSETIVLPDAGGKDKPAEQQQLELVTLLGYDAIPAILDPSFVGAAEAEAWMEADEQVLGLSIGGDSRAYPIKMLSRHEIVNDAVGGVPVAVTW